MTLRAGLINGNNINQDYDFGYLLKSISLPGCIEGLQVQTGKVTAGKGFVACERTNGNKPFIFLELSADYVIDTTGTKKIWIEIPQAKLDDGQENNEDGTGIAIISSGSSYPSKNYIPLASITGGSITDERYMINILQNQIDTQNERIGDAEEDIAQINTDLSNYSSSSKSFTLGEDISPALSPVSRRDDGKIYKYVGSSISSTNDSSFANGTVDGFVSLSSSLVVILYRVSNILYVKAGTVSGTAITRGASQTITTSASGTTPSGRLEKVSASSFCVVYRHSDSASTYAAKAKAGTISGTTITLGSEAVMSAYFNSDHTIYNLRQIDTTKLVVSWRGTALGNTTVYNVVQIITVSGTTITVGNAVNTTTYDFLGLEVLSTTVFICQSQNIVRRFTISGTTITAGADLTLDASYTSGYLMYIDSNRCLFIGTKTSQGYGCILNTSSTTITQGTVYLLYSTTGFGYPVRYGQNGFFASGTFYIYATSAIYPAGIISSVGYPIQFSTYSVLSAYTNASGLVYYWTNNDYNNVIGIIKDAGLSTENKTVALGGILGGFTDLIAGLSYGISQTSSGLVGGNSSGIKNLADSISSTELYIRL